MPLLLNEDRTNVRLFFFHNQFNFRKESNRMKIENHVVSTKTPHTGTAS
jgi:hypothetical protein